MAIVPAGRSDPFAWVPAAGGPQVTPGITVRLFGEAWSPGHDGELQRRAGEDLPAALGVAAVRHELWPARRRGVRWVAVAELRGHSVPCARVSGEVDTIEGALRSLAVVDLSPKRHHGLHWYPDNEHGRGEVAVVDGERLAVHDAGDQADGGPWRWERRHRPAEAIGVLFGLASPVLSGRAASREAAIAAAIAAPNELERRCVQLLGPFADLFEHGRELGREEAREALARALGELGGSR